MDINKLGYYRTLLQEERDRRKDSLFDNQLGMDVSIRDATSELSSYDNHPGDLGTETFEAEKNFSFRTSDKFVLSEVDAALKKVEDGSFGVCEVCHRNIAEERLDIRPYARLCIDCENDYEQKPHDEEKGRPIEEQVLYPPFGRSFTDHSVEDKVPYDGEDTWQAVAMYGPANSNISDVEGDDMGYVQDVEQISNTQYKKQLEGNPYEERTV